MIVPFKILIAALSTLIVLLGKLSEDIRLVPKKPFPSAWGIIMSALIGVAVFFWTISIFTKITPLSIVLGIVLCVISVAYYIGNLDIEQSNKSEVAVDVPNLAEFVGKKGKIIGKINDESENAYIGTLIEGGEDIIVHLEEAVVKEGDEFTITRADGDGIHAEIDY